MSVADLVILICKLSLLPFVVGILRHEYFTSALTRGWVAWMETLSGVYRERVNDVKTSTFETVWSAVCGDICYLLSCPVCLTYWITAAVGVAMFGLPYWFPGSWEAQAPSLALSLIFVAYTVNNVDPDPQDKERRKQRGERLQNILDRIDSEQALAWESSLPPRKNDGSDVEFYQFNHNTPPRSENNPETVTPKEVVKDESKASTTCSHKDCHQKEKA